MPAAISLSPRVVGSGGRIAGTTPSSQLLNIPGGRFVRFAGNVKDTQTGRVLGKNVSSPDAIRFATEGQAAQRASTVATQTAAGIRPGTTVETLPQSQEEAQARANAQNEARNVEGRSIFDQMLANAQGFGEFSTQQAARGSEQALAAGKISLINRGLLNSTNLESQEARERSRLDFVNLGINETTARSRNEILSGKVGFIERQFEQSPDPALFASLQSAASSAPSSQNVSTPSRSGGSSSGGGSTDFAGREVQQFGRLTFTGRDSNNAAIERNRVLAQNQASGKEILAAKGINLGSRSLAEIRSLLIRANVRLDTPQDAQNLTAQQVARIQAEINKGR